MRTAGACPLIVLALTGGKVDVVVAAVDEIVEHGGVAAVAEFHAVRVVDIERLRDRVGEHHVVALDEHDAMERRVGQRQIAEIEVARAAKVARLDRRLL